MQRDETETMSEKERGDKKVMCVELKEYRWRKEEEEEGEESEREKEEKLWIVNVVPQYSKPVLITSNPLSRGPFLHYINLYTKTIYNIYIESINYSK